MTEKSIIEELRLKADLITSGERIAWGSDAALMREAADAIAALEGEAEKRFEEREKLALQLADMMDIIKSQQVRIYELERDVVGANKSADEYADLYVVEKSARPAHDAEVRKAVLAEYFETGDGPTYGMLQVRLENANKTIEMQRQALLDLRDDLAKQKKVNELVVFAPAQKLAECRRATLLEAADKATFISCAQELRRMAEDLA